MAFLPRPFLFVATLDTREQRAGRAHPGVVTWLASRFYGRGGTAGSAETVSGSHGDVPIGGSRHNGRLESVPGTAPGGSSWSWSGLASTDQLTISVVPFQLVWTSTSSSETRSAATAGRSEGWVFHAKRKAL